MDPFNSQAGAFEFGSRPESYYFFTYYHPQYQSEYRTYQDDQYPFFTFDNPQRPGGSAYHPPSTTSPTNFDPSGGYVTLSTLGSHEHDNFFARHVTTVPLGKVSRHSELMPQVVARKTTISLKQDVRAATEPQPCVVPALCQGHADLSECAEVDDELDCPGEPAGDEDEDVKSSGEEKDNGNSHRCEPHRTSRVFRSARSRNRYSPMESKGPSRKRKSTVRRVSRGSDDEKPKKRREAVSLACYFCRKRKIACRQPPEGNPDRACHECKARGLDCKYPTESHRGTRRNSATTHEHTH